MEACECDFFPVVAWGKPIRICVGETNFSMSVGAHVACFHAQHSFFPSTSPILSLAPAHTLTLFWSHFFTLFHLSLPLPQPHSFRYHPHALSPQPHHFTLPSIFPSLFLTFQNSFRYLVFSVLTNDEIVSTSLPMSLSRPPSLTLSRPLTPSPPPSLFQVSRVSSACQ